ncbi:MAG TPA: hypothetical protein VM143_18705 [Acidimicrobiales bacterium]|nr:hypothetical protein [Acidimicrobiales bacterium]
MGRASSSKKVARAASTGGGRTTRGSRPLAWYAAVVLVVLLGVSGIVFSRQERRDELAVGKGSSAPVANRDHWHAAYGVYLCDKFAPPITDTRDPKGIHTHGDGIVHIHPFVRSAAGRNATLAVFADATGLELSDDHVQEPGGKDHKSGETKCGGKTGVVQVKVNQKVITENVDKFKLSDGDLVTIAFAPKGAEIPPPPSAADLARLNPETEKVEPEGTGATTASTVAGDTSTTAPAVGGETTTTAAP